MESHGLLLGVAWIGKSKEIPRRIHKSVHGVGFSTSRASTSKEYKKSEPE